MSFHDAIYIGTDINTIAALLTYRVLGTPAVRQLLRGFSELEPLRVVLVIPSTKEEP